MSPLKARLVALDPTTIASYLLGGALYAVVLLLGLHMV